MPEPASGGRAGARDPGWREVLLVGAAVVAVVLGAAMLTSVLPPDLQRVVLQTPLLIAVLIGGTGWLLWRIGRRPST